MDDHEARKIAKKAARNAAYHKAHRDEILARQRAYREAHRDRLSAVKRAYYERNRERRLEQMRVNRLRRKIIDAGYELPDDLKVAA